MGLPSAVLTITMEAKEKAGAFVVFEVAEADLGAHEVVVFEGYDVHVGVGVDG